MANRSKIIVGLAALALGAALTSGPAFAQTHRHSLKTGSAASTAEISSPEHGYGSLFDYVPVPTTSSARDIDDPAATGGGSLGSNRMMEIGHRW